MHYPEPDEVDTTSQFYDVCAGMPNGSEKESTVRIYCCAAQKHQRWDLTQEELDEQDAIGVFSFNGLIEAEWFQKRILDGEFVPTVKFFAALMANDLIYTDLTDFEDEDEGEFDEEEKPQLKVFKVRVIYNDRTKRNSWFTLLDLNADEAEQTVIARVKKYRNLLAQRGPIVQIEVTEFKGPFGPGKILAEER